MIFCPPTPLTSHLHGSKILLAILAAVLLAEGEAGYPPTFAPQSPTLLLAANPPGRLFPAPPPRDRSTPFTGKKRVGVPDGDPRQDLLDPVMVSQDMGIIGGDETDLFPDPVNLEEIRVQHHKGIRLVLKGIDKAALLLGEVSIVIVGAAGVAKDRGGGVVPAVPVQRFQRSFDGVDRIPPERPPLLLRSKHGVAEVLHVPADKRVKHALLPIARERPHPPFGEPVDGPVERRGVGIGREVLLQVLQDRPPEPTRHPGTLAVDALAGVPPKPLLLHVAAHPTPSGSR